MSRYVRLGPIPRVSVTAPYKSMCAYFDGSLGLGLGGRAGFKGIADMPISGGTGRGRVKTGGQQVRGHVLWYELG